MGSEVEESPTVAIGSYGRTRSYDAAHDPDAARDWRDTTLGEFVSLQRGHDLPEYDRHEGDVPVMGSFGVTGWHDAARASGPGVTVGRSGASFGVVSYCTRDYWPLNTCLYATDFHGNDPRFAYYLLKSIDFRRYNSGSAQPSLNRNYIRGIAVRVPSLPEQRRIAHILGALDDKIEVNRRTNRTLEAIARAIFKSWFVDFDPVRKKMDEGETELSLNLAALDPNCEGFAIENAPGCMLTTLGDVAVASKNLVSPEEIAREVVDHYSIPAFDDSQVPSREAGLSIKSSKFAVPRGCVLVSRLNPRIHRVWLPQLAGERRGVCSTEFLVLLPKPPMTIEYLYALVSSDQFGDGLASRVTGTSGSHQRVKRSDALSVPAFVPRASTLEAYSDIARPILQQAGRLREESRLLAEFRDALLPGLLDGSLSSGPERTRAEN